MKKLIYNENTREIDVVEKEDAPEPEKSRIRKVKDWLENNKIFFEIFSFVFIGVMGIVISVFGVKLNKIIVDINQRQLEIAENEIIRRLDISDDMYTETWETKGKWQGTVRKYSDDVIEMVLNWCKENGYPGDIEYTQSDGQIKKYHVKWREVA